MNKSKNKRKHKVQSSAQDLKRLDVKEDKEIFEDTGVFEYIENDNGDMEIKINAKEVYDELINSRPIPIPVERLNNIFRKYASVDDRQAALANALAKCIYEYEASGHDLSKVTGTASIKRSILEVDAFRIISTYDLSNFKTESEFAFFSVREDLIRSFEQMAKEQTANEQTKKNEDKV